LEKIREALAKARTDKAFRVQHPIDSGSENRSRSHTPVGETTDGAGKIVEETGSANIATPANAATSPEPSGRIDEGPMPRSHAATQDSGDLTGAPEGGPTKSKALLDAVTNARNSAEVHRSLNTEGSGDGVQSGDFKGTPSEAEEGALARDFAQDREVESEDDTDRSPDEDEAESDIALEAEFASRSWPRRHPLVFCGLAGVFLIWIFHTFVMPLDPVVAEIEANLSPITLAIGQTIGPLLDEVSQVVSDAWSSVIGAARDALE
jgi:hypothetical protein